MYIQTQHLKNEVSLRTPKQSCDKNNTDRLERRVNELGVKHSQIQILSNDRVNQKCILICLSLPEYSRGDMSDNVLFFLLLFFLKI